MDLDPVTLETKEELFQAFIELHSRLGYEDPCSCARAFAQFSEKVSELMFRNFDR